MKSTISICTCVLGVLATCYGQLVTDGSHRSGGGQVVGPESAVLGIGHGPRPPWWNGAGYPEPRMWGGWDHESETWMHVLDVPTEQYPLLRFGFFQYYDLWTGFRHRTAYVYVAHHPPDFLVPGAYRAWSVRTDTDYEWRYLGNWREGDGWDAVVVERELTGLVEFCRGDEDGQIWVVIVFDRPAMFMGYWSNYQYCPQTNTYGIGVSEWGDMLGPITRWPLYYQWPPCYLLWTAGGHREW